MKKRAGVFSKIPARSFYGLRILKLVQMGVFGFSRAGLTSLYGFGLKQGISLGLDE